MYLFNNKLTIFISLLCILITISSFQFVHHANADFIGTWSVTSSLPNKIANQSSISYNNRLYEFGGANTTTIQTSLFSKPDSVGDITKWNILSTESPNRYYQASAINGNFVYLLGGTVYPNPSVQSSIYIGQLDQNNGDISPWKISSNLLPYPNQLGSAISINNRLYVAGGEDNNQGQIHREVYFADINTSDGSLGPWQIAGSLPLPLKGFSMLTDTKGNIIILGGQTTGNIAQLTVYTTHVDSTTGQLSGWKSLTNFPSNANIQKAVLIGNTIAVVNRYFSSGNGYDSLLYANFLPDGTLSSWSESGNRFPPIGNGTLNVVGDYLYWAGGYNEYSGYTDVVYFTKLTNLTPTLTPTPSPTPTPTPTPTSTISMHHFAQNDTQWGLDIYDSADTLGIFPPFINRWGCAITSTAMVLNSYGITQMPDGTPLNPGSLNSWLKTYHGYLTGHGSGGSYSYLDWTSISRLALSDKIAGRSATDIMVQVLFNPLNFANIFASDFSQKPPIPDIIQTHNASTSGHFVVVTGKTDTSYSIQDPYWNLPDLSSFHNTVDEVVRLIPSHTDLSYLTLVIDPDVRILLTDANGKKVGDNGMKQFVDIPNAVYGLEKPIGSPIDRQTMGKGVQRLLIPQPQSSTYTIQLSSEKIQTFTFNVSALEKDGTSLVKTYTGVIGPKSMQTYTIQYSSTKPSRIQKKSTYASILSDIRWLFELRYVDEKYEHSFTEHYSQRNNYEKLHVKHVNTNWRHAQDMLASQTLRKGHSSGSVKDIAYTILSEDADTLSSL